jgi:hypothetical protein
LTIEVKHFIDGGGEHVVDAAAVYGDEARYHELRNRLLGANFAPARNEKGNEQRQTWVAEDGAMVDFFIPEGIGTPGPGKLQKLRGNFAAVVTPGLHLAFEQIVRVPLSGKTLDGASANREVPVCGPGAFVVLKALAHKSRGEPEDAYDLYFLSRFFGDGPEDVGGRIVKLLEDDCAIQALQYLGDNFVEHGQLGPHHVARFLSGDLDEEIQADVVGIELAMLGACRS